MVGTHSKRRAIQGNPATRAQMTLLEKDTRLAVEAELQLGFEGALGTLTRDLFAQASAGGLAACDDSAVFGWFMSRPAPSDKGPGQD